MRRLISVHSTLLQASDPNHGLKPSYRGRDIRCKSHPARTSKKNSRLTRYIQLVHTLQGHVDDLRTLIQCGICIRPLYEPFTLACGHTFCYSVRSYIYMRSRSYILTMLHQCLTSWFAGGRAKRTCPDCRAPVKTQPAPAYLVSTTNNLRPNPWI